MKKIFLLAFLLMPTLLVSQSHNKYITKINDTFYIFIDTVIYEKHYYRDMFLILKNVNENDKVVISVNSPGGITATGVHMYNEIKNCKAEVTVEVTMAHSAASFIVMAADKVKINTGAYMIFHTLRIDGKLSGNIIKSDEDISMLKTWVSKFYNKIYKNFLTKKEISNILDGKEIVLYEDELRKRIEK